MILCFFLLKSWYLSSSGILLNFRTNHQENLENIILVQFYNEVRNPNLVLHYLTRQFCYFLFFVQVSINQLFRNNQKKYLNWKLSNSLKFLLFINHSKCTINKPETQEKTSNGIQQHYADKYIRGEEYRGDDKCVRRAVLKKSHSKLSILRLRPERSSHTSMWSPCSTQRLGVY